MHHCLKQKVFELEFLPLASTTISDLFILLSHCQSQLSHHGCKEGHFWSLQWEEVGTVLSGARNKTAEMYTVAKNY